MKLNFISNLVKRFNQNKKARAKINLGYGAPANIIIKLAETKDELEQAFQVLHDAYVDESWMDPQPSGLRMTKYHALPMTAVLVAIDLTSNRVVGTISIIRNSELGLPLDAVFPLKAVKEKYSKLGEISSLAVHKDYRKDSTQVFWPLIRSVIRFARDVMRVDAYVIGVHPTRHHLYTSILGFKKLKNSDTKNYGFVKNAPVSAYIAELSQQEEWSKKIYGKSEPTKNWYQYCFKVDLPKDQYRFFNERYFPVQKAVMTPELFEYFFQIKTDTVETLAETEKIHVGRQFANANNLRIAALNQVLPAENKRRGQRYHAKISGKVFLENSKVQEIDISIISFSESGIGLHCNINLPDTFYIRALLGMKDKTWLKVEVKNRQNGFYGCQIISQDENWTEFVKAITATESQPNAESQPDAEL